LGEFVGRDFHISKLIRGTSHLSSQI
jgi:hypothetical protein